MKGSTAAYIQSLLFIVIFAVLAVTDHTVLAIVALILAWMFDDCADGRRENEEDEE